MSFDFKQAFSQLASQPVQVPRDPKTILRLVVALLTVANLAAGLMVLQPWGATPEELEQNLIALRGQQTNSEAEVERLRKIVEKVERAREEGDGFMRNYFLDRRTASSTIVSELQEAASTAGLKQEVHTFDDQPIEGSDELSMMTISGNYEGAYENLVKFIHLLDRSPRFLILDTLVVAPERRAGTLNVNLSMNAFVIDDPSREDSVEETVQPEETAEPEADEPAPAPIEENLAG